MSIIENMCPNTFYMCSKSYEFWFTPTIDGNSRRIELFRYDFQEEDDCVECYLCVLPFAFAVDITLCPCNLYTSSNCCYFCSNNKIKPLCFGQKIKANNEICKKNIHFNQNLEKPTQNERILAFQTRKKTSQNPDNLNKMDITNDNRTSILSSPTPMSSSIVVLYSPTSRNTECESDCVFVKNKCTKTLEVVNECEI